MYMDFNPLPVLKTTRLDVSMVQRLLPIYDQYISRPRFTNNPDEKLRPGISSSTNSILFKQSMSIRKSFFPRPPVITIIIHLIKSINVILLSRYLKKTRGELQYYYCFTGKRIIKS